MSGTLATWRDGGGDGHATLDSLTLTTVYGGHECKLALTRAPEFDSLEHSDYDLSDRLAIESDMAWIDGKAYTMEETSARYVCTPRHRADTLPAPLPASHVAGMYPMPSVLPVSTETEHYSFGAGAL